MQKLYEDMKLRIETTTKLNRIPEDIRKQRKGFREWDFVSSKNDHQTILQILIDGRDPNAVDVEGRPLPTLVYLAREKRPQFHHHFKAGAMNALVICRWNSFYRFPYKDRLSQRFEKELPGVDIFVCTADPLIEPPSLVINTVLSVMAYDYPPEKLSISLSDDGGSDLTFYAMLEAATFSKQWLPFCKKFKVEPRSPEAYFRTAFEPVNDPVKAKEWLSVKKLYEDMKLRIETTTKLNRIPEDIRKQRKGFREWDFVSSKNDHQTILQILIDGRDPNAVDVEGRPLPTLVYLAREKRPQFHHHFKAGAMNALGIIKDK
ncbi:Cellulose synthase - like 10 [Theobroma cacao]|nr:Cellulose synthase - like 10 [Theobroma cacao]